MQADAGKRCWIVLSLMLACSVAVGSERERVDGEEQVAAWIARTWNPRGVLPTNRCFHLHWTIEYRSVPTADEMQQLRVEVRNALDHPEKRQLALYEARLVGKYDTLATDAWVDPRAGVWRLSTTNHFLGRSEFADFGLDGDTHWCLTSGQLIVGSPTAPEPLYDYSRSLDMYMTHLSWAMSGGMWNGYSNDLETPVVRLAGDEWRAETRDDSRGLLFRAKGKWFDEDKSGSVTEAYVHQKRGQPDDWELKYVSTGRRYFPELDYWAPERVEEWQGPPLRLERVFRVTGFEYVDAPRVHELVRPPDFDGSDPIRGKSTFASILDLRPGSRGYQKMTDRGVEFTPIEKSRAARHYSRLKVYGWVSAVAVAAALVVLRLRRRFAPHGSKELVV